MITSDMLMVVVASTLTLKNITANPSFKRNTSIDDTFSITAEFSHPKEHQLTFNTYSILPFFFWFPTVSLSSLILLRCPALHSLRCGDEELQRQKFQETSAKIALDLLDVAHKEFVNVSCACFSPNTRTHTPTQVHTHIYGCHSLGPQAPLALTHTREVL